MYYVFNPMGYMAPKTGYGLPLAADYGLPLVGGYPAPLAAGGYPAPLAAGGYPAPLAAGLGLLAGALDGDPPEEERWTGPWGEERWGESPEILLGTAPGGRCVAIPNLRRGTVITVRETDEAVLIGIWSIARLRRPERGRIALTVYLPATVILDKTSGQARSRIADQTVTLRGANLQEVANAAAEAWCRATQA